MSVACTPTGDTSAKLQHPSSVDSPAPQTEKERASTYLCTLLRGGELLTCTPMWCRVECPAFSDCSVEKGETVDMGVGACNASERDRCCSSGGVQWLA